MPLPPPLSLPLPMPLRTWFGADPTPVVAGRIVVLSGSLPAGARAAVLSTELCTSAAVVVQEESIPTTALSFRGDVRAQESEIIVGDGSRIALLPYGLGAVVSVDRSAVLRVCDEHDFSAYLRDADQAWHSGVFTDAATNPLLALADLRALGGPDAGGGPDVRVLVGADGQVRSSPFGLPIGRIDTPLVDLRRRWRELDLRRGVPGGVDLGEVLDEDDRADAVRERPWLGRYAFAAALVRHFRAVGSRSGTTSRLDAASARPADSPRVTVATAQGELVVDRSHRELWQEPVTFS